MGTWEGLRPVDVLYSNAARERYSHDFNYLAYHQSRRAEFEAAALQGRDALWPFLLWYSKREHKTDIW